MAKRPAAPKAPKSVESHARRGHPENIPTAEYQSVLEKKEQHLRPRLAYRAPQSGSRPAASLAQQGPAGLEDLVVQAPPLYIQEKVHPKALIDDLLRDTKAGWSTRAGGVTPDLFADFNGIPKGVDKTEFYQHDAELVEPDDPRDLATGDGEPRRARRDSGARSTISTRHTASSSPNFQWSTTSRDVKDSDQITREPEQVKAFRDTWRDGIHSYLTYLRDRLTVARDLLADSGLIFVRDR